MDSSEEAAFERAAAARAAISEIITVVGSGQTDLAGAFERADVEPLVGRCLAVKVFEAVPGVGKVRARRTMQNVGLSEDIWLADVPAEVRSSLVKALGSDAESD